MSIQEICTVRDNQTLSRNIFALTIHAPKIVALAKPGQFVHIACGDANLLRRPISICQAHEETLKIVFVVKGEGTKWLSQRKTGDTLDILGPVGNGFDLTRLGDHPVFIGGGIGVPPMLPTMQAARGVAHSRRQSSASATKTRLFSKRIFRLSAPYTRQPMTARMASTALYPMF